MSLAEVVEFGAPVPRWLADLLNRIRRVDDAEAARDLPREQEWITRDGYHRERRGAATSAGRRSSTSASSPASRASPRCRTRSRLDTAQALRPKLDAAERPPHHAAPAPARPAVGAQLLAARAEAPRQRRGEFPCARKALTEAIAERSDTAARWTASPKSLNGIQIELDRRNRELKTASTCAWRTSKREHARAAALQAERILALRRCRRGMPAHWLDAGELALLADK